MEFYKTNRKLLEELKADVQNVMDIEITDIMMSAFMFKSKNYYSNAKSKEQINPQPLEKICKTFNLNFRDYIIADQPKISEEVYIPSINQYYVPKENKENDNDLNKIIIELGNKIEKLEKQNSIDLLNRQAEIYKKLNDLQSHIDTVNISTHNVYNSTRRCAELLAKLCELWGGDNNGKSR